MTRSSKFHLCSLNNIISLLIYNKSIIRVNASDVIIFLFSSYNEDFILCLDWGEFCWQFIWVSYLDALSSLGSQFMNIEFSIRIIKVMKSWLHWSKNIIRFKAYNIMKETSKFINLTLHLDVWSRIFLEKGIVLMYLYL